MPGFIKYYHFDEFCHHTVHVFLPTPQQLSFNICTGQAILPIASKSEDFSDFSEFPHAGVNN